MPRNSMHANWFAPLLAAGALALAWPHQDPVSGTGAPAAARPPTEAERRAETTRQMLGAWMLERYEHPTETVLPGDVRGCALVSEGYIMIEFHARRPARLPVGEQWVMLYQSGLYQWLFESDTRITCATVLGHGNFSGDDAYEAPGTPKQFDIEVGKVNLVLSKPDGVRLVFNRLPPRDKLSEDTLMRMEELRALRGQR